jgi:hypothetical protein
MTSREAGRHRRQLTPQPPQSLLLPQRLGGDGEPGVYYNTDPVPNGSRLFTPGLDSIGIGQEIGFGPGIGTGPRTAIGRGRGPGQAGAGGRRALRGALVRDRRAFAVALSTTLAGVAAAAVFGSLAPLHSTSMTSGRHGAAGGLPPQASAPWSAGPLGSPSGQATPGSPSGPAAPRRPPGPTTPPGPLRRTGQVATSPRPPGQAPASRTGPAASTAPRTSTGTVARTRTTVSTASRSSSSKARPESKVVVRYLVDSQGLGEFQGQVQVVNDGTQPIAGWQIVIALPDDTVTAVQNAGGFASHGILLLQPADMAEVVSPGGTLNVFFVAEGTETIPAACAFNGIACA